MNANLAWIFTNFNISRVKCESVRFTYGVLTQHQCCRCQCSRGTRVISMIKKEKKNLQTKEKIYSANINTINQNSIEEQL